RPAGEGHVDRGCHRLAATEPEVRLRARNEPDERIDLLDDAIAQGSERLHVEPPTRREIAHPDDDVVDHLGPFHLESRGRESLMASKPAAGPSPARTGPPSSTSGRSPPRTRCRPSAASSAYAPRRP